jgi:hypothetical protein
MQTMIAVLAACLTLTFVQLCFGTSRAQAGSHIPEFCKHRLRSVPEQMPDAGPQVLPGLSAPAAALR